MESVVTLRKELIKDTHSKFKILGIPPIFEPNELDFIITLLNKVASGDPVSSKRSHEIAANLGFNQEDVISFIENYTEQDDKSNIVGLFGLSLNNYSHKFEINGTKLSTFCGWDTLFLPQVLQKTAKIEVTDLISKDLIQIEISPEKTISVSPPTTVLSIVIPGSNVKTLREAYNVFCVNVRFFSSEENLNNWFEEREFKPVVLSVEEGFLLGSLAFADLIQKGKKVI